MAKARITTIAEAVRDALNGAVLSVPFVAAVRFRREVRIAGLDELDVGIYRFGERPTPEEDDTGDRSGDEIEYTIEVAVRKKVTTDAQTEDLVILCEEIRAFCARLGLATVAGDIVAAGASYDPVHDEEHLTKGIFFGLVTVSLRGFEG